MMRLLGGAACAMLFSSGLMTSTAMAQVNQGATASSVNQGVNAGAIATAAYRAEASMQDDIERQETVTTRPHPETDAQGITAGSWTILPSVGVEEKWNDNIYATNNTANNGGVVSDYITTISPDVVVRSNWNNGLVVLDANSQNGFYAKHTTENFNDYAVSANGRLDITRQEYIAFRGGYFSQHEDRTSPNNDFGSKPTTYGLTDGQLEYYNKLNRLSLTVDGQVTKYDYNDVSNAAGGFIPNKDRNRDEYSGTGRVGYELQPLLEAFVKGEYSDRSYDHKVASDGYERSSTGYSVLGGIALDLGGITFGEVGIGYMSRKYDDVRFNTVSGLTANASVTWNVTPLTTLKVAGQRTIEETITFGSPGFIGSVGTFTVDHELLRNLLLNGFARVSYNEYQLVGRNDTIVGGGAGATYLLNRYANVSLSFSHTNQDSSENTLNYTQNLGLVRLTLQM
jgi:hypothetical protein